MKILGLNISRDKKKIDKTKEPNFVKELPPNIGYITSQQNNKPITSFWNTENAVKNGLKASTFVYSCVSKKMTNVAAVPWFIETLQGDKWILDVEHPANKIINSPNPFQTFNTIQKFNVAYLELGGNALLIKVRAGDMFTDLLGKRNQEVAEIWIAKPDQIKPIYNDKEYVQFYEFNNGGKKTPIPATDIIHFLYPDPNEVMWGMSPLKAAEQLTDTDVQSIAFNQASIANRVLPDGILNFKHDLSPSQWKEARRQLKESIMGPDNAHLPIVIGSEATYNDFSKSMAELDFVNSSKWNAKRICSVFDIHPAIVGLDETSNHKMDTLMTMFWDNTIIPTLDMLQIGYEHALKNDFAVPFRLRYDISNVPALREIFFKKVAVAKNLHAMGIPFNIINQRLSLNIERYVNDEVSFMPKNTITIEEIVAMLDSGGVEF